jgi:hypothetical protein
VTGLHSIDQVHAPYILIAYAVQERLTSETRHIHAINAV